MKQSLMAAVVTLVSIAAFGATPGTAKGTITINGKAKNLAYAYAWKEPSDFRKGEVDTIVVLSDAKLDDKALASKFARIDLAKNGKFTGVEVHLTPKETIPSATIYTAAEDGYFDAMGMHKWEKKSLTSTAISGKLATDSATNHFFKTSWAYSATFDAPISPAPKK